MKFSATKKIINDLFCNIITLKNSVLWSSKRVCGPSYHSSEHPVDDVSKEVKEKFKDLKEVAEGDAKPEREATTQGVEQAPILDSVVNSVFDFVRIQS